MCARALVKWRNTWGRNTWRRRSDMAEKTIMYWNCKFPQLNRSRLDITGTVGSPTRSVFKVCDSTIAICSCVLKSSTRTTFKPSVSQSISPKTISPPPVVQSSPFFSHSMKKTPMWVHCILGDLEGVRNALHRGQNANQRSPFGVSGLMYAASGNHPDIMALLLGQPGIDINSSDDSILVGGTPLHWAISGGSSEMVEMLLKQPNLESLDVRDIHGYTPLMLALARGSFASINLLMEKMLEEHRVSQEEKEKGASLPP